MSEKTVQLTFAPSLKAGISEELGIDADVRMGDAKEAILHQEANRPEHKAMPRRYARHYYDMYRLMRSDVAGRAIAQPELLARVVAFKEKFHRTPWSRLEDARPGTLRLAPQEARLAELGADYDAMRPMIFGEAPAFESIVKAMEKLEDLVNGTAAG